MEEKELIVKIRELRQIKPNQNWVIFNKRQILAKESERGFEFLQFFLLRPFSISLMIIFVVFGAFGFAQNSLPGDLLYPIKKFTEKSQIVFVSGKEKSKIDLELTNKRLEELNQITQKNEVKKIVPAINEFQSSVSKAAKNLIKSKNVDKKIIEETKRIVETKETIERTLGTNIGGEEEVENISKVVVERLIKDLEKRTLTESQGRIFEEAKNFFENENCSEALIKILELNQNK